MIIKIFLYVTNQFLKSLGRSEKLLFNTHMIFFINYYYINLVLITSNKELSIKSIIFDNIISNSKYAVLSIAT